MPMTPEQHEQEMINRYNRSITGATDGPKISAIVCPKYYDKGCTLCELTYAYFKAQLGKEHFLRERARSLNRRLNYYSNVIFPSNPSEVVIFQYGDELHKILFGYATDKMSEYVGYDHPKTGRNFFVKKEIPGGNKRQTKYSIEMRLNATPIPDPSVLQGKLHDLDHVLELIEQKQVKLITQRDLVEERTEMRMLPSWLGPGFRKFYVEVPVHYVNRDEFNAIQDGKVNPFAEAGIKLASKKPETIIMSNIPAPAPTSWGAWEAPAPVNQTPPLAQDTPKHPCFGTYDPNSPLCNDRCMKAGQAEACKAATQQPKADQSEELRRIASRLYK
jgi:hypothetical protein